MGLTVLNKANQKFREYSLTAELWDWGKSLLIALIAVVITNQFIITQCRVIGSSMQPTILQGERLLINQLIYKFRFPRRGEVITFADPDTSQPKPVKNLVKRIVGIPQDIIEVRGGLLYVNGTLTSEAYTDVAFEDGDFGPVTVSAGQVFVMGDNRHAKASRDSRIFGAISTKLIIGRAEFIFWPLKQIKANLR